MVECFEEFWTDSEKDKGNLLRIGSDSYIFFDLAEKKGFAEKLLRVFAQFLEELIVQNFLRYTDSKMLTI